MMAELNMNYFHLHATDDEGWRLEIPELPELTSGYSFIISRSFPAFWDFHQIIK